MKSYNFTFIISTDAENEEEARALLEEKLADMTMEDIASEGIIEEDELPN